VICAEIIGHMKTTRSQSHTDKLKASKKNNFLNKILSSNFSNEYLDAPIVNGFKENQTTTTLRFYIDQIKAGKDNNQLIREGISKHVISFFSNYTRGKITLTKIDFEKEYLAGKSLLEIGEIYKLSKENVSFLRQLYEIDRKGASYINRKKTESPLTDRQKEIIIGSLMGDACRASPTGASVKFKHSEKQKAYITWKFNELENISSKYSFQTKSYFHEVFKANYNYTVFYTNANSDIEIILKEFYQGADKQPTQNLIDQISPLSLAVWYMDDGMTDFGARPSEPDKDLTKITPVAQICTDSFNKTELDMTILWLKNKYNISARLRSHYKSNETRYRIVINNESVKDFFDLIRPHFIQEMLYKIDLNAYIAKRKRTGGSCKGYEKYTNEESEDFSIFSEIDNSNQIEG
jgi:LAGLIDADG DNA endonuclease family